MRPPTNCSSSQFHRLARFSVGGVLLLLVDNVRARQMILDGLKIKALVTVCSPHIGVGRWVPPIDAGVWSMSCLSPDLNKLNASPQERRHRHLYHLFAITCRDRLGEHPDDGVIPVQSALGLSLRRVSERLTIHLDYGDQIAGVDPHHPRGMDPTYLHPMLNRCVHLF